MLKFRIDKGNNKAIQLIRDCSFLISKNLKFFNFNKNLKIDNFNRKDIN